MTPEQLESIALSVIRFGEARRKAAEDSSNGKLAMAFLEEGLATNLPNSTVELLEEVERLATINAQLLATCSTALNSIEMDVSYDASGLEESFRCPLCEACSVEYRPRSDIRHYDDCAVAVLRRAAGIAPEGVTHGGGVEVERLHSLLRRTLATIGELGPAHVSSELEVIAEEIRAEIGRQEEGRENS